MEMVQVVKVEQMVKVEQVNVEQVVKVGKMVEEWLVVVDLRPPRSHQVHQVVQRRAQVLGFHPTLVTFRRVVGGGGGVGGGGSERAAATVVVVEAKVAWCRAALNLAFSFFGGPR